MDLYAYLARPSRLGLATTLATSAVVMVFCLAFEFVVPAQSGHLVSYPAQNNFNLRSIIFYATAGGMHILLCAAGIIFFSVQMQRAESKLELKRIMIAAVIGFCVVFGIVLLACKLNINLVQQSYQDRVAPLQQDERLASLLAERTILFLGFKYQPLALFPLLLVAFGVAVAVVACFWIAQKAIEFVNRADDLKKQHIVEMKRSVAQLITLISIIFATSTLATIALMQLGRDWIEKGAARDTYIQSGDAMSIFWSAGYTSATGAMVLIPLCWIAGYTRRIQRQARYAGGRASFYDHVYEVISLKGVSQAGAAVLVPVLTSIIAAVFGS